jgi:hypothetical protein
MNNLKSAHLQIGLLVLTACIVLLSACHSYHIEATVKNDTGGPISLLEVDYPSASFGGDAVAAAGEFHHRIQTRGSGPLKVQYTDGRGKQIQITGPTLYENQEGRIEIDLLPDGKADFRPALNPAH